MTGVIKDSTVTISITSVGAKVTSSGVPAIIISGSLAITLTGLSLLAGMAIWKKSERNSVEGTKLAQQKNK